MSKQKKLSQGQKSQIKLANIFRNIKAKQQQQSNPTHGPITTITTAPVAIGNSIRGAQSQVIQTSKGCRVIGRDFGFACTASGLTTLNNWTQVGGMPLTPCCLPSTILRNYVQMYSEFAIKSITMHYITSSPTSSTGDILFYFNKNRDSSLPNCTDNSFLPFVLSDSHTIIGPQWTNHSAMILPVYQFRSTDYAMTAEGHDQAAGELFVYSKTSTTDSPGYIIFDYDIEFRELSVNPRSGILPVSRAQYNPISFGFNSTAVTNLTTVASFTVTGNNIANLSSAMPTGTAVGDIFKVVFDVTNSTLVNPAWTNITPANAFAYSTGAAFTIKDGTTLYAKYTQLGGSFPLTLYPSLAAAISSGAVMLMGVTATVTFTLCANISLVYTENSQSQSSY
jgi:hypothetical protein